MTDFPTLDVHGDEEPPTRSDDRSRPSSAGSRRVRTVVRGASAVAAGATLLLGCSLIADLSQFDGDAGVVDAGYQRAVRCDFEQGNENLGRNPYNATQNWGIVDVAQAIDPTEADGGPPDGLSPNHCLAITIAW